MSNGKVKRSAIHAAVPAPMNLTAGVGGMSEGLSPTILDVFVQSCTGTEYKIIINNHAELSDYCQIAGNRDVLKRTIYFTDFILNKYTERLPFLEFILSLQIRLSVMFLHVYGQYYMCCVFKKIQLKNVLKNYLTITISRISMVASSP